MNYIFQNTRYRIHMNGGNLSEAEQTRDQLSYEICYTNILNSLKSLNDYYYTKIEYTDFESIKETFDITTIEDKELIYKTIKLANENNPNYYMVNNVTNYQQFLSEVDKHSSKNRDKFVIFEDNINSNDLKSKRRDNLIILNVENINIYESYAKIDSFPTNLLNTFSYIFYPGFFTSDMFKRHRKEFILLVSRLIFSMFKGLNTNQGSRGMEPNEINTMWSKCGLASSITEPYGNNLLFFEKDTNSKYVSYTTADYNSWEKKIKPTSATLVKILEDINIKTTIGDETGAAPGKQTKKQQQQQQQQKPQPGALGPGALTPEQIKKINELFDALRAANDVSSYNKALIDDSTFVGITKDIRDKIIAEESINKKDIEFLEVNKSVSDIVINYIESGKQKDANKKGNFIDSKNKMAVAIKSYFVKSLGSISTGSLIKDIFIPYSTKTWNPNISFK